ncbi:MAG: hypothetical protein AAF702_42790 [Chloroflexota bacterium]
MNITVEGFRHEVVEGAGNKKTMGFPSPLSSVVILYALTKHTLVESDVFVRSISKYIMAAGLWSLQLEHTGLTVL